MPKNTKSRVYKDREFGIYVLWKFLPANFKGMKKREIKKMGFSNPLISKVIKIKTQTEFAKNFNIKDLGTLTDWNNRILNENITSPFLNSEFHSQVSNVKDHVILPNIAKLKSKISEQNRTILALKKELLILKKTKSRKIHKHTHRTHVQKINSDESTRQIQIRQIPEPLHIDKETSTSMVQRLKGFFRFGK